MSWLSPRKTSSSSSSPQTMALAIAGPSSSSSSSSTPTLPFARFQPILAHFPASSSSTSTSSPLTPIQVPQFSFDDSGELDAPFESRLSTEDELHLDSELATSTAYDPATATLARLLDGCTTLELRCLAPAFPYSPDSSHPPPTVSQTTLRLSFVVPLRAFAGGSPFFITPEGGLGLFLLSENNRLYRFVFPSLNLSPKQGESVYGYDEDGVDCFHLEEALIESVGSEKGEAGKVMWTALSGDEQGIVMGIREGVLVVRIQDEVPDYRVIRPTHYLPTFFSRSRIPTSIIALQSITTPTGTYIYTFSQDSKIRVFSLQSNTQLAIVDLNQKAGGSGSAPGTPSRAGTLGPHSQLVHAAQGIDQLSATLMHVYESPYPLPAGSHAHYIATFTPTPGGSGYVTVHRCGIQQGKVVELKALGSVECDMAVADGDFRGFAVELVESVEGGLGLANPVMGSCWRLWVCFDVAGRTVIQHQDATSLFLELGELPAEDEWSPVYDPQETIQPHLDQAFFDKIFEGDLEHNLVVKEVYLDELFVPGRFSANSIEAGLQEYVRVFMAKIPKADLPEQLKYEYTKLREKVETIVGLKMDIQVLQKLDGEVDMDAVDERDPEEEAIWSTTAFHWHSFWAFVQRIDRQARWPVALSPYGTSPGSGVLIACRGALVVPTLQDEITLLQGLTPSDEDILQNAAAPGLQTFYPALASQNTRGGILACADVAKAFIERSTDDAMLSFEDSLVDLAFAADPRSIQALAETFDQLVAEHPIAQEALEKLDEVIPEGTAIPHLALNKIMDILMARELLPNWKLEGEGLHASFTGLSLAVSTLTQVAGTRVHLFTGLMLVLGRLACRKPGEDSAMLGSIISRGLAAYHRLRTLRWVTERDAEDVKVAQRDAAVALGPTQPVSNEASFSLLHALYESKRGVFSSTAAGSTSLMAGASAILYESALLSDSPITSATAMNAEFAAGLLKIGMYSGLSDLIGWYTSTPALEYLKGRALVKQGQLEEAVVCFDRVAGTMTPSGWQDIDRTGLALVLPNEVVTLGLPQYYTDLVALFESAKDTINSIHYADLMIRASPEDDPSTEVMWSKVFRGHLKLQQFEQAYITLMENPFANLSTDNTSAKERPLAMLVQLMCEAGQAPELLNLPFGKHQASVEFELNFKARNSEPDNNPNYYRILYSWYIKKSDYQQAAKIIYWQGQRHGEAALDKRPDDFVPLAAAQAQSYLSAINALSMVDEVNRFCHLPPLASARPSFAKRAKRSGFVPLDKFSPSKREGSAVVSLEDIRKEYAIVLAALNVCKHLQPPSTRSLGTAEGCIEAFINADIAMYDNAFALASACGSDMSSIFDSITSRCLNVSGLLDSGHAVLAASRAKWITESQTSCTWRGDIAERAWRYLQLSLERHDGPKTNHVYLNLVVEKVVSASPSFPLPRWLIGSGLSANADGLVRMGLKYGKIDEAVEWESERVRKLPVTNSTTGQRPFLSYTIVDQVLEATKTGSGKTGSLAAGNALKGDVEGRLKVMQNIR